MERFFNTAGPQKPEMNYTIDPLSRFDLDEIMMLIRHQRYFVLHAPRQTGKTSCMLALRDYLNRQGDYMAVYANVEGGQASRNDIESVIRSTIDTLVGEMRLVMKDDKADNARQSIVDIGVDSRLSQFLSVLCQSLDKPLVLMIDEIDALAGDSLVSILRQIRSGYANRPAAFPQTVILCGVRDVRDYRIVLSNQDIVTGGSAFNIKATSLRLGNFSEEEIHELYMQHTRETGQEFEEACFPLVWKATEGQPWLVNALGHEVTWNKPLTDHYGGPVQHIVMELRIRRGNLDTVIAKGLEQTAQYMDLVGTVDEGHLIIFDRTQEKGWDERIWHRPYEHGGRTIKVWGM